MTPSNVKMLKFEEILIDALVAISGIYGSIFARSIRPSGVATPGGSGKECASTFGERRIPSPIPNAKKE